MSSTRSLHREPCVRVRRGDRRHRREHLADLVAVVVESDPECAAARVVEDRERQPRLEDVVRDLDRMERRLPRERALLGRLERVRRTARPASCTASGSRVPRPRAPARDRSHRPAIACGHVLHEHLRGRAADARVVAPCRASSRGDRRAALTASSYCQVWQYTMSIASRPSSSFVPTPLSSAARARHVVPHERAVRARRHHRSRRGARCAGRRR